MGIPTRSAETLRRAEELQLGTSYTASAAEAVKGADLVIVSVPVGASEEVARQIAATLKPGAIVTDVGSTKRIDQTITVRIASAQRNNSRTTFQYSCQS